jgi:hypothetical protein
LNFLLIGKIFEQKHLEDITASNIGFGAIWAEVITMGFLYSTLLQLGQKEFYLAFVL